MHSRRHGWAAACLATVVLVLAGCSGATGGPPEPPTPSGTPGDPCPLVDKAVPTCGPIWGVSTQPPTLAGVEAVEQTVGRTFDFVYRYHDVVGQIPDQAERDVIARGSLLHIAIAARTFGGAGNVTYADIARGMYDDNLRAQARGIASLKEAVYLTFEQEANQRDKVGGERGGSADFIAAWRHLHDLYEQEKVTNAVWVWVMTGNAANLPRTAALWPGNDYVDWISWNIYNQSGCRGNNINPGKLETFEEGVQVFYDWVTTDGKAAGIDSSKPMMISEAGSVTYPGDPELTAQWYAAIPDALQRYPQVKAVTLWNSGGGQGGVCDYRFQLNPVVAKGVAQAGDQLSPGALVPSPG